MSKVLSFFFALAIVSSAYSQKAQTVFITDAEITWLNDEISNLKASLELMQTAVNNEDGSQVAANRTAIIKSVNRLSSNCNIMTGKIDTEIHPPTKRSGDDLDTPPNYYYNKKKQVEALQELSLSDTNVLILNESALQLKALKDKISAGKYYFNPKYNEAQSNLKMVYEMLELAKKFNSIINRSQVQ